MIAFAVYKTVSRFIKLEPRAAKPLARNAD